MEKEGRGIEGVKGLWGKAKDEVFWVIVFGVMIRFVLLGYGEWQDAFFNVKYTDVDFRVLSDGAKAMTRGGSPYERSTYRYTPLLGILLMPSIYTHPVIGKLVFVGMDIFVSFLILKILLILLPKNQLKNTAKYLALWVLNPIVINVSTRGNAEAVISASVMLSLYFCLVRCPIMSAIVIGLGVHLKLYPVIYIPSLALFSAFCFLEKKNPSSSSKSSSKSSSSKMSLVWEMVLVVGYVFFYLLIATISFLILGGIMYSQYGQEFLNETYLYHFGRVDHRHNFSVYFYYLYLAGPEKNTMGLIMFLPQLLLSLLAPLSLLLFPHLSPLPPPQKGGKITFFSAKRRERMERDVVFCVFLQTLFFVAFNKVCTVQYFVWYITFLPLVSPFISLSKKVIFMMAGGWGASQALWLFFAYLLEFQNVNTFIFIWAAGLLFFFSHVGIGVGCVIGWEGGEGEKKKN